MSWDPGAYGRAFADVYDDWYGDRDSPADVVDLFVGTTGPAGSRRLLELGVGTGRLALPLAAAGWRVTGLDASPEMLAVLAAKSADVTAIVGDAAARSAYPDGPFDVVLAAYNFVFNLPDRAAQRACLAAAADVAAPGAVLALEAFVPEPTPIPGLMSSPGPAPDVDIVAEFRVGHGGAADMVVGEHRHADGRRRPWRVCPASPDELDDLAAVAGWQLQARWATWSQAPFLPAESSNHVSVYRLA